MPYCAVLVAAGVVLIEAKSVLENYQKMKSAARDMPAVVKRIIDAVTDKDAEKIIELIKDNDKRDENE